MRRIIFLSIVAVFLSCGIFTPRDDFEDPDENSKEIDYFNFRALMDGTGEIFANVNLDELLDDGLEYIEVDRRFNKSQLKTKLMQLENQYDTSMQVKWEKDNNSTSRVGDTIFIDGVLYSVTLNNEQQNYYSGVSDFVIARSDRWRIYRWKDIPSGADKSFFAPPD